MRLVAFFFPPAANSLRKGAADLLEQSSKIEFRSALVFTELKFLRRNVLSSSSSSFRTARLCQKPFCY